jgi:hypothetical protein
VAKSFTVRMWVGELCVSGSEVYRDAKYVILVDCSWLGMRMRDK